MQALAILFWLILAIVFYSYVGYALLLSFLQLFRKRRQKIAPGINEPSVTLVIAAFNEAAILPHKIQNSLSLDYPHEKFSIIIVTDGSTDNSHLLAGKHPSIKVLHQPERLGKSAALNRAMESISSEIVVFTDANTMLNKESIRFLVAQFADERTGAVAGEKKVRDQSGLGNAEGLYWKYESFMKKIDASFYSVTGAAGELFALRTRLFKPVPVNMILDDLFISIDVCLQGYRIGYEPRAYAIELPSVYFRDEENRKIRIAAGAFQLLSLIDYKKLRAQPLFGFQFFSRRWLRWAFCPAALIALFVLNLLLALFHEQSLYVYLFSLHLIFYLAALGGWMLMRNNRSFAILTIPFYFLFMNYCMLRGWMLFRHKNIPVLWEKAYREAG